MEGDGNTEQQFYKYDAVPINFIYSYCGFKLQSPVRHD